MRPVYESNIPEGWDEVELRKAAIFKRGHTWKKEQETERAGPDTIPVIRIPNIKDRLDLEGLLHLRGVKETDKDAAAVKKGWILFVGSNGNPARIGDSALLDEDAEMVFASFLMGMTTRDPERLTPEFLALWMRLHNVHESFSRTSQQTTGLANYSWGAIKKLPVRFPISSEKQESIVSTIRLADEAIQKTRAELVASRRVKKALMQQLFTRGIPGRHESITEEKWLTYPESWDRTELRHIAHINSGFTMGRDLNRAETVETSYVTVSNVLDGGFDLSSVGTVEIKKSELATGLLAPGDILMTEGGDRDKVGRGAMWQGQIHPCAYQNHIFRVRLDKDRYKPELFHYLIQTYQAKRYFFSHAKQTSNLNTINSREVKRFPVACPPPPEQEEMLEVLANIERVIEASCDQIAALEKLKQSLLQNLLTGKARVKVGA